MSSKPENPPGRTGDLEKLTRDARGLLDMSRVELRAAEERFNALAFHQQLQLASAVEGDDRKDLLYLKTDCTDLVQALPPQDIYLTVKLVGPDDALGLLGAASPEQIHHILDMDCWHDGQLAPKQALRWMEVLLQLDEEELQRILRELEPELLAVMLGQWVKRSDEPFAPPDVRYGEQYSVTPASIQVDDPIASAFLAEVYDVSAQLFQQVVRLILAEQEWVAETEAAARREDRLEQKGFPTEADAQQIYVVVPLSDLPAPAGPTEEALPSVAEQRLFFRRAIDAAVERQMLSARTAQVLEKELAALANKVIVAHGTDITDRAAVELAIEQAAHYVSIGLEYVSSGSQAVAVDRLKEFELDYLFRIGHSVLCSLRRRLWRELGDFDLDALVLRLDPPYCYLLDAIRQARPMMPAADRPGAVQPIRCYDEVAYLERMIDEIGDLALLHTQVLPLWSVPASAMHLGPEPTYGQLSATVAASAIIGKLPPGPLAPGEVQKLWEAFRDEPDQAQELALNWLDLLLGQAGWLERSCAVARRFWREQLGAMREELASRAAGLGGPPPPDELKEIQTFLTRLPGGPKRCK